MFCGNTLFLLFYETVKNKKKNKEINPYQLLKPIYKYFIKEEEHKEDNEGCVVFADFASSHSSFSSNCIKYHFKEFKTTNQDIESFEIVAGWGGGCLSHSGIGIKLLYDDHKGMIVYSKYGSDRKNPYERYSMNFDKETADYIMYSLDRYKIFELKDLYESQKWWTGRKGGRCDISINYKNGISKKKSIGFIGFPPDNNDFSRLLNFLTILSKDNLKFNKIKNEVVKIK